MAKQKAISTKPTVTIVGTKDSKYLKEGKEYHASDIVAQKLVKNGKAILKKGK
jgi:hypothetical protein